MKNESILGLQIGLAKIAEQELDDVKLALKIFKIKKKVDDTVAPMREALAKAINRDELGDQEAIRKATELGMEETDITLDTLTLDDLKPFHLSVQTLGYLSPILEEEEEK